MEGSVPQPKADTETKSSQGVFLDFKLSNHNDGDDAKSKIELNLFAPRNPNLSRGDDNDDGKKSKVFTCNFCKRVFSTSQALGGHQNAHKQERALAKRRNQGIIEVNPSRDFSSLNFPYHPFSSFPSNPFHGSFNRPPPLGVRLDSMVCKPSHPLASSSRPYHLPHGWSSLSRQALMNLLQPSLSFNNGGLGISGPSTGANRGFGESLQANVAVNRVSESTSMGSDKQNCDGSGIDLSLKL